MTAETYIADAELEKQISALNDAQDSPSQGRALALLTVLLSRCSEANFTTVEALIPKLTDLASKSDDQLVKVEVTAAAGRLSWSANGICKLVRLFLPDTTLHEGITLSGVEGRD